mmetsp:Transcript_59626/g.71651  ORF Transcript_59626/g.71651 Transcript_59626/m.71651 type:complete len:94 (-) Transcript_59626:1613-1894(-)
MQKANNLTVDPRSISMFRVLVFVLYLFLLLYGCRIPGLMYAWNAACVVCFSLDIQDELVIDPARNDGKNHPGLVVHHANHGIVKENKGPRTSS